MILIVDYGRGNLFSLRQAFLRLGTDPVVSSDPDLLANAERIVFPGVGAFGDAMAGLRERGLVEPLKAAAAAGTPLLGICVGCQLLLSCGEEFGQHEGLGIIPGRVARLPDPVPGDPDATRIPNIGWRPIEITSVSPVLGQLDRGVMMYFLHTYAPRPDNPAHIAATVSINGQRIAAAVARDNILGVQFHPEKSGPAGLVLLRAFLDDTRTT
jgi:glutamine amidotransferase